VPNTKLDLWVARKLHLRVVLVTNALVVHAGSDALDRRRLTVIPLTMFRNQIQVTFKEARSFEENEVRPSRGTCHLAGWNMDL
jgi:hypothetical protein